MGDIELFHLPTSTPDHTLVHGKALLDGHAHATASFRRGIDLTAGFDLKGQASASIGDVLAASLTAGLDITGGLSLEAAVPLDLFTAAGIIAKFQAELSATVYGAATLTLGRAEWEARVLAALPDEMRPFATAVLDEVEVSAGLWGRATFAAEVIAQAALTGSLFGDQPGFTFGFSYGAAVQFGAGASFQANVGLHDPRRMVDRIADAVAALILDACGVGDDLTPTAAGTAADTMDLPLDPKDIAAGAAKLLVPMGLRTAMGVGVGLLEDSSKRADAAVAAAAHGLLDEIRRQLLTTAHEAALAVVQTQLTNLGFKRLAEHITDAERADIAKAFRELADAVEKLQEFTPADAAAWIAAFASMLDPLDRILEFGFIPDKVLVPLTKGVTLLWCASVTLGRVVTIGATPPADGLFPGTAAQPHAPASVASRIRQDAGTVTYQDAVDYLLNQADIENVVLAAVPSFQPVHDWVRRVLGTDVTSLFVLVLADLAAPTKDQTSHLVDLLEQVAADAIDHTIVPTLLKPLEAANPGDRMTAMLVDDLATPLLTALPRIVLPALRGSADDNVAVRLRETLSAVLLHALNQVQIAAIRVLLEHALTNGEAALRQLAVDEQANGTSSKTHSLFNDLSSLLLAPEDIEGILELGADTLASLHETTLEPALDLVTAVLDLGLGEDANKTLTVLANTDDPPPAANLNGAISKVTDGGLKTIDLVVPRAAELVGLYLTHFGSRLGIVFNDIATAVLNGIHEVVAELEKVEQDLLKLYNDALAAVEALLKQIAEDAHRLADELRAEAETVRTTLRNEVIGDIKVAIAGWPQWAQDAILDLFGSLYDGLTFLPTMLEDALAGTIDDVADLLAAAVANTDGSRKAADDVVRNSATSRSTSGLTFDLRVEILGVTVFSLGTVRVAPQRTGDVVVRAIAGSGSYQSYLDTNLPRSQMVGQVRAQAAAYKARMDGVIASQQTQSAVDGLVTGQTPQIVIEAPTSGTVFEHGTMALIRVRGINRTFLSTSVGVPPRVLVNVNGQPWAYQSADWADDDGVLLSAQITATPLPILPANAVDARQVDGVTTLARDATANEFRPRTLQAMRADGSVVERTIIDRHDAVTQGHKVVFDPATLLGLATGTQAHLARHASAGTTFAPSLDQHTGEGVTKRAKKARKASGKGTSAAKSKTRATANGDTRPTNAPANGNGYGLSAGALRNMLDAQRAAGEHPLAVAQLRARGVGGVDIDDGPDPGGGGLHPIPRPNSAPSAPPSVPNTPRGVPLMLGRMGLNTLVVVVADGEGRTAMATTTFTLVPASTMALANKATGRVLDVSGGQGATGDGTDVFTWDWLHGTNQLWTPTAISGGHLVAAHSGLCLDVTSTPKQRADTGQPGAQIDLTTSGPDCVEISNPSRGLLTADPAYLQLRSMPREEGPAGLAVDTQRWLPVRVPRLDPSAHYLIHARHSGRYLDVRLNEAASYGDGAHVQQYDLNRGPNQRWQLVEVTRGEYLILVEHSGRCLDAWQSGTALGTPVIAWHPHGGPNQRWRILPTDAGWYRFENVKSNLVLDVAGIATGNLAPLQLWSWLSGPNQQFWLDADTDTDTDVPGLVAAKHSGMALDVPGASGQPGTALQQWPWNNGGNQRWRLRPAAGGGFTVSAGHTGQLLICPVGAANGTPVTQAVADGSDAQRWIPTACEPGYVRLTHAGSQRVLDVRGGSGARAPGAAVQVWDWLDGDNQKWRLPR